MTKLRLINVNLELLPRSINSVLIWWELLPINGYVPTTRDNVDIVTAFYYDVCDEAAKRVDNVD